MSINAPFFDALVLGYSGLTGKHLLRELIKSDKVKHIICLGRKAPEYDHHKLQFIQADMSKLTNHVDAFGSVSRVFCCLGTTIKKAGSREAFRKVDYDMVVNAALLAAQAGANHFSVVSAVGANARSGIFYNKVKGEMEEALQQAVLKRLSIFRPGLLMGNREEFRFGERLGMALVPLFEWMIPVRFRSIKAETVARAMLLNAIKTDEGVEFFYKDDMEVLSKSL